MPNAIAEGKKRMPFSQPHIEVLMTSYNHASYVEEQVRSILAQTWPELSLTVSDNCSTDGSWEILRRLEEENNDRIKLLRNTTKAGWPQNHFYLLANADLSADYYAWSDSDDAWLPDKLKMAMEVMRPYGQEEPVLYASRLIVTDSTGRETALYPLMNRRAPSFGNSLVQCITHGPSIVFNRPARELISINLDGPMPTSQDWWAYIAVMGAGGRVLYDPRPTVYYRQHGYNALGANFGIHAKISRAKSIIDGTFKKKIGLNLDLLLEREDFLTPDNKKILAAMTTLHQGDIGPIKRLNLTRKAHIYRQSTIETALIYLMAIMNLL